MTNPSDPYIGPSDAHAHGLGRPLGDDLPPIERVLIVGFMGSGKTKVGQVLARLLDWSFHDFDQEVCARVGLPIPDIFRQHGEGFFREVEERVGEKLLREREVVLASGGGWPAIPGRMEGLGPTTLSVWLQVTGEEAIRRARKDGPTRPLLEVPDPVSKAEALLKEREPFYGCAQVVLDSVGTRPEELAERITHLMNERGGR